MAAPLKTPPSYLVTSVDHALRLATILQLEGSLTVSAAAERLGVARSTAHRLLAMLVFRDFARQDPDRIYRAGPVLELAGTSGSATARLRAQALEPLTRLVELVEETANLVIRTGDTARFIVSVECRQALRIGNREGMVFPVHQVSGGLAMLAELPDAELDALYAPERFAERETERPDLATLKKELAAIRSSGLAANLERSERGVRALGRAVRDQSGAVVAGVSISIPSVRYSAEQIPRLDAALRFAVDAISVRL